MWGIALQPEEIATACQSEEILMSNQGLGRVEVILTLLSHHLSDPSAIPIVSTLKLYLQNISSDKSTQKGAQYQVIRETQNHPATWRQEK